MPRDIRITHIISRANQVAFQLRQLHFAEFRPPAETWGPAINMIMDIERIEISVDLAGVDPEQLRISIDEGHLYLRGVRQILDPTCRESAGCRVLIMEIDEGPFERIIPLPRDVDLDSDHIAVRQENGLLQIEIPRQS